MGIRMVPIYNKGMTSYYAKVHYRRGPLPHPGEIIMPSHPTRSAPFALNRLAFGIAISIGSSLVTSAIAQTGERQIEEVTVTATYLTGPLDDIAGTVSVISAQEIEQQLADDLNDITRFQPGISMD